MTLRKRLFLVSRKAAYQGALIVAQGLMFTNAAWAYDLVPSRVAEFKTSPVHEALTIATLACAQDAVAESSELRRNCLKMVDSLPQLGENYLACARAKDCKLSSALDLHLDSTEVHEVIAGVRWPDDPTRLLATGKSTLRGGYNFFHVCRAAQEEYLSCANRFCMSHFGNLQFLHSMHPTSPWCKVLPDSPTCRLAKKSDLETIELWVRWLANVATNVIKPADPLFKRGDDLPSLMFDQKHCNEERWRFWFWNVVPMYPSSMTVEQLLYANCNDLVGNGKCSVTLPENEKDRTTQRLAAGALLHLIQDSFSQGHVRRVPAAGRSEQAFIACTPVLQFHDYAQQMKADKTFHEKTDKYPLVDPSCAVENPSVDDPITAGANVLLMLRSRKTGEDPGEKVWRYLRDRVFRMGQ